MAEAHTATYMVPPATSGSSAVTKLPLRDFSIRRTAASEELAIFEQTPVTDRVSNGWMDNPPLLKPGKTMQIRVSYTIGGRLEFPPLGDEDEQFLKSVHAE